MPVKTEAIGKSYPPFEYELGKEKIGEYARAVGEENPVYFDRAAAQRGRLPRRGGAADVRRRLLVGRRGAARVSTPTWTSNFAMLVHGGQEFAWGEPVCSGDVISTVASVKDIYEKGGMGFYVFETVSTNQDGAEVARGTWTNIVRGVS